MARPNQTPTPRVKIPRLSGLFGAPVQQTHNENPIRVDSRVGSIEILAPLLSVGAPAIEASLFAGDFEFIGEYVDASGNPAPALIGIERKRISDLLQSVGEQRLNGYQLYKMSESFTHSYLLIEETYRLSPLTGGIEVLDYETNYWKRVHGEFGEATGYKRIISFLHSVSRSGVTILHTSNPYETAVLIHTLYQWWQKPYAKHESLDVVYTPIHTESASPGRTTKYNMISPIKQLTWRWAAQLPGIASNKAGLLALGFDNAYCLATASLKELEAVIGKGKIAQKIHNLINGRGDGVK